MSIQNELSTLDKQYMDAAKQSLVNEFESHKEEIIDKCVEGYMELVSVILSTPGSLVSLEDELDLFVEKLQNFKYIYVEDKQVRLTTPDLMNFEVDGDELPILAIIIEGVPNEYFEIPQAVYTTSVLSEMILRRLGATKEFGYAEKAFKLVDFEMAEYIRKELAMTESFVKFPFSGEGSTEINIFSVLEDFIDESFDGWVSEAEAKIF